MFSKSCQVLLRNRTLCSSIFTPSSYFSTGNGNNLLLSPKLTESYYHHPSNIPLLNHTIGQHLDLLKDAFPNHECYLFRGEGNKRYTYKSFLDEVDSLATSLIDIGFQPGDRIGVWLPNTSENCAMTYAASKVGVIKVNINPAYLERELIYSINKVGCKGLILRPNVKTMDCIKILNKIVPELTETNGELNAKAVPTLKHIILAVGNNEISTADRSRFPKRLHLYNDLIHKGAQSRQEERCKRQSQFDGDTPLAIFYTSGTTGQPKAATLTNHHLLNNTCSILLLHTHPRFMTRACCPVPMFHIFGEMGGTLNINAPGCFTAFPAALPDSIETMRTIQEEKCTVLMGPPIIFRDILFHSKRKEYNMQSLLFGLIGAAPVNPLLIEQLEREIPIKTISQVYGQTENAGALTMSVFAENDKTRRFGSIGKAIPRVELKIVDTNNRTVPIGQEGEICARAFNVMNGYYGDEDKTCETITPSGWLKTGDIGVMDECGYIYFRARRKEMIIIGGINVYPVEIENYLLEHPDIAEAQVFSIPDQRYGEVACAWIKVRSGRTINDLEDVRRFLLEKVAFFKVPKYLKIIESFTPYATSTGKIQKYKLTETMVKELLKTSM